MAETAKPTIPPRAKLVTAVCRHSGQALRAARALYGPDHIVYLAECQGEGVWLVAVLPPHPER